MEPTVPHRGPGMAEGRQKESQYSPIGGQTIKIIKKAAVPSCIRVRPFDRFCVGYEKVYAFLFVFFWKEHTLQSISVEKASTYCSVTLSLFLVLPRSGFSLGQGWAQFSFVCIFLLLLLLKVSLPRGWVSRSVISFGTAVLLVHPVRPARWHINYSAVMCVRLVCCSCFVVVVVGQRG